MDPHNASGSDPRADEDRRLHRRVLAGERAVSHDLVRRFLPELRRRLQHAFPSLKTDPDLEGCALEGLADYFQAPERYPQERYTLGSFLWLAAKRNGINLLKRRRPRQGALLFEPEMVAGAAEERMEEWERAIGDIPGLPEEVTMDELWAQLRGSLRDGDRPVMELVLERTASLENCIAALGLDLRSAADTRSAKNARDRCHAALRRARERYANG